MRFIASLLVLFSFSALSVDLTHTLKTGTTWSNTVGGSVTHGNAKLSRAQHRWRPRQIRLLTSSGWNVDNAGDVDGLKYTTTNDDYRIKDDYVSGESGSYVNTAIGHNGLLAQQNTATSAGYHEGERKLMGESSSYSLELTKAESSNGGAEHGVSYKRVEENQNTTYGSVTEYGGQHTLVEKYSGLR